MYTVCWSPKGGSGTTVVASAIALRHQEPHTLVDLAGDLPAVLGLDDGGRGIRDALADDTATTDLHHLATPINEQHSLIRRGTAVNVAIDSPQVTILVRREISTVLRAVGMNDLTASVTMPLEPP